MLTEVKRTHGFGSVLGKTDAIRGMKMRGWAEETEPQQGQPLGAGQLSGWRAHYGEGRREPACGGYVKSSGSACYV